MLLWKESASEDVQSRPTLCDPMDCSPPGTSIHGIFQARVLEWVAISFSRGCCWPRDQTRVSRIAGRHFIIWATREALDATLSGINLFFRNFVAYRNATEFCICLYCILQLYWIHWSSISLLVESLKFSLYKIKASANKNNFTSSFPIQVTFISLSYMIVLARTSSTILDVSGKSGHSWLICDLTGKAFKLSTLSMMLAVGLSYMAFIEIWSF